MGSREVTMGDFIVKADGLRKVYENGTEALRGVDLEIKRGEFCVIAGPNGAGKTTFLRMVYGEIDPTGGKISVSPSPSSMGVMPQEAMLYEDLTIWEHVYYFTLLKKLPKTEAADSSHRAIKMLDLDKREDDLIRDLSGGLKKRVNLAQALAGNNELLILDEPTNGLDPGIRKKTLETIRDCHDGGSAIIFTTHYLDEIENYIDRLVIFDKGSIVYNGNARDVLGKIGYDLEMELPASDQTISRFEGSGLRYSSDGGRVKLFIKRDEVKKVWDLFSEKELSDIKMMRPSLEEAYLGLVGVDGDVR